jgi:hypothetical protein
MVVFRFRHLLVLDEDCVCMVWAAITKSSEVGGYRNGSSERLHIHLSRDVQYVPARTTS